MSSILPSLIILGLVAAVAAVLALCRLSPQEVAEQRIAASRVLGATTIVQGAHFAEEWATGFHLRFPALLGLDPMPLWVFVFFNLAWIAVWLVSIPLLRVGGTGAFFAAWFLAIAGMLNGVAHPALALVSGGYFPGLMTSPAIGIAGVVLWRRLQGATIKPSQLC